MKKLVDLILFRQRFYDEDQKKEMVSKEKETILREKPDLSNKAATFEAKKQVDKIE